MARAYILKDFQGKGYGIKMIKLIESNAIDIWKKKYDDDVIGIDCLDIVGPEQAKIFLINGWLYVGTTKGFSRVKRKPFGGKIKDHDYPIIGKMERINPKWHIYVKNLIE